MMIATKGMIGLAALIASGFVAADEATRNRTASILPADAVISDVKSDAEFERLHLQAKAALQMLIERQQTNEQDRVAAARLECANQSWPYYSADCLTSNGKPARHPKRVVGNERPAQQISRRFARAAGPATR
jgi:hypothetical protein